MKKLMDLNGWFYEKDLSVDVVVRRVFAVLLGSVLLAMASLLWLLLWLLVGMGPSVLVTLGAVVACLLALAVTAGTAYAVWALWTGEL